MDKALNRCVDREVQCALKLWIVEDSQQTPPTECQQTPPAEPQQAPLTERAGSLTERHGRIVEVGGRYRVERMLGKGSFGFVSLARSLSTGSHVAIKSVGASFRRTAESEIRILQRLRHRNIVQLIEIVEGRSGVLHLVMEYVDGGTLQQLVERRSDSHRTRDLATSFLSVPLALRPFVEAACACDRSSASGTLPEAEAAPLLYSIAEAVAHCHASGICHRDLKLENMLISAGGDTPSTAAAATAAATTSATATTPSAARLIDFGLSSVVGADSSKTLFKDHGTPAYSAPEVQQCNNARYAPHRSTNPGRAACCLRSSLPAVAAPAQSTR